MVIVIVIAMVIAMVIATVLATNMTSDEVNTQSLMLDFFYHYMYKQPCSNVHCTCTCDMQKPTSLTRVHVGWPQYCIMKGHKGKVNCLLYPHSQSKAYHTDYLLSGSSDFSVKLWDLYSGVLVHTFAVHGGEVKNIVSCPPEINVSMECDFLYI